MIQRRIIIRWCSCKAFGLRISAFPLCRSARLTAAMNYVSAMQIETLNFDGAPSIGENALALALIALHQDDPTANLLAPIVINLSTQFAAQCIDPDMRYSHRYRLLLALELAS